MTENAQKQGNRCCAEVTTSTNNNAVSSLTLNEFIAVPTWQQWASKGSIDVVKSLVEREHFDGIHIVRVPLGHGQQTAAAPTTVDRLWVLDRVFVGQQVTDVATGRVEHADP